MSAGCHLQWNVRCACHKEIVVCLATINDFHLQVACHLSMKPILVDVISPHPYIVPSLAEKIVIKTIPERN